MMRIVFLIATIASSLAFAPQVEYGRPSKTVLEAESSRRDALVSGASALLVAGGILADGGVPKPAFAFSQQLEDWETEPAQMKTDGKYDLNSAFVVSEKYIDCV